MRPATNTFGKTGIAPRGAVPVVEEHHRGTGMIKSKKGPPAEHFSVRFSQEDIARIDALIGICSTQWREGTRSDVVRMLLLMSLERVAQGEVLLARPLTSSGSDSDSGSPPPREK